MGAGKHHVLTGEDAIPMSELRKEGGRALAKVVLRSIPISPNEKKWEKVPRALGWHLLATGILNFIPQAIGPAYESITLRVTCSSSTIADPEVHDVTFHQLEGGRHSFLQTNSRQPSTLPSVTILAMFWEPLRFIMKWFRKRGSLMRRSHAMATGGECHRSVI